MSALSALPYPVSLPATPSAFADSTTTASVTPSLVINLPLTVYSQVLPMGWYLFCIPQITMTQTVTTIASYNCFVRGGVGAGTLYLGQEATTAGDPAVGTQNTLTGSVYSDGVNPTVITVQVNTVAGGGTTTVPATTLFRFSMA